MKSIAVSYQYIALAIMSIGLLSYNTLISEDINHVDESGMKQGYWIINGNMSSEPGYSPSSTVEEGNYENDLKTGIWKKYYPSGQVRSEITFSRNKPVGNYTLYYENGVIEEQGNWQKTKNIGQFIRNYENGEPHQEFIFSDSGKRNGIQLYYHSNGQLAMEVNIVNGQEAGVMKRYNEEGDLVEEKSFEKGKYQSGSTKTYDQSKEKYVPKPAEIKANQNITKSTSEPSEEEETNAAHHFKPDGHNILYNKNKQMTQTGLFKNGRLWDGKWYKYNKNGILIRVDIYRNGKFIGHGLMEEQ